MTAALLIALREGLEAALIVGIVLSYLRQIRMPALRLYIWLGVGAAVVLCIALALGIQVIGFELEGRAEEIFEGLTLFVAVAVLTWMIFWMRYQARLLRTSLECNVQQAVDTGRNGRLFAVAFTAVFREGVETALFLSAAAFATEGQGTLLGALLGLAMSLVSGYLFFATTARLNVRAFFNVTSVLLLLFAAGLLAHGIHEFQEAGVFSSYKAQIWDTNHILNERSTAGELLKALFGYNGNPSLEEVLGYLMYWILTLLGLRWWMERKFSSARALEKA